MNIIGDFIDNDDEPLSPSPPPSLKRKFEFSSWSATTPHLGFPPQSTTPLSSPAASRSSKGYFMTGLKEQREEELKGRDEVAVGVKQDKAVLEEDEDEDEDEEDEEEPQQSDTVLRDMLDTHLTEMYDNYTANPLLPATITSITLPPCTTTFPQYVDLIPALAMYDEDKLGLPAIVSLIASLRPLAAAYAESHKVVGTLMEQGNSRIVACITAAVADVCRLEEDLAGADEMLDASQLVAAGLAKEKEGAWNATKAREAQLDTKETRTKALSAKNEKEGIALKRERALAEKETADAKAKQKAVLTRERKVTDRETNVMARGIVAGKKEDAVKERESQVAIREARVAERLEAVEEREAEGREQIEEKLAEGAAADAAMLFDMAALVAKRAAVGNK